MTRLCWRGSFSVNKRRPMVLRVPWRLFECRRPPSRKPNGIKNSSALQPASFTAIQKGSGKKKHTHTKHPPTTHMQAQCPHRTSEATVAEEAEIAFVITEDHSALKSHASLGAQFARAAVEAVLVAAPKGSLIRGFAEL